MPAVMQSLISFNTNRIPDWVRRAIRTSLAVLLFGLLGQNVIVKLDDYAWRSEFRQSCTWAGITSIVVTAPLIGKVVQVGAERSFGTAAGGLLGFLAFDYGRHLFTDETDEIFLAVSAALVTVLAAYLAQKLSLDQSAKLFAYTYLLVTSNSHPERGAALTAFLRTSGIIAGVLVILLLSVIILPRSAAVESIRESRKALSALADMNQLVWAKYNEAYSHVIDLDERDEDGYIPLPGDEYTDKQQEAKLEAECEKHLTGVYQSVFKVLENITLSRAEIYVGHIGKHAFFLPGIAWAPMGRWRVPETELRVVLDSIRRLARLLYTVHLDFQDGFTEAMQHILKRRYPKHLITGLAGSLQAALKDLLEAYPSKDTVRVDNLERFKEGVRSLLQVADSSRKPVVTQMKRMSSKSSEISMTAAAAARQLQQQQQLGDHEGHRRGSVSAQVLAHLGSPRRAAGSWQQQRDAAGPGSAHGLGSYLSKRDRAASLSIHPSSTTTFGFKTDPQQQRGTRADASASSADGGSPKRLSDHDHLTVDPTFEMDCHEDHPAVDSHDDDRQQAAPGRLPVASVSPFGSIDNGSSEAPPPPPPRPIDDLRSRQDNDEQPPPGMLFPDTPEGYVLQVRWYSFQFLMDEIAEELEEAFAATSAVIVKVLNNI